MSLRMPAQKLTAYILASDPSMVEPATCVMPPGPKQGEKAEISSAISVKLTSLSGNSHTS